MAAPTQDALPLGKPGAVKACPANAGAAVVPTMVATAPTIATRLRLCMEFGPSARVLSDTEQPAAALFPPARASTPNGTGKISHGSQGNATRDQATRSRSTSPSGAAAAPRASCTGR